MRLSSPHPKLELESHEGQWLRGLLLGDENEVRLLVRVAEGRVTAAARSDLGPVPVLAGATPERLRALALRWGIRRIVTIDADAEPGCQLPDLLERLLDPHVRSEPPWSAALARLASLGRHRWLGPWLAADGTYGLIAPPEGDAALQAICLRLRHGQVDRIVGPSALGLDPGSGIERVIAAIRLQVGKPQLIVSGPTRALRRWLESEHPATALERAVLRGWLRVEARSRRAALAGIGIRLWELRRDRPATRPSQA